MELPHYDEVYVISDLHMGGKADFQILRESQRLAGFIGLVAEQNPKGKVALILNGDIIDTLAEEGPDYITVDNAESVVSGIMNDQKFAPVWDALATLVKKPGRTLIFILGNHDLELSFPVVQHAITERLTASDPAARGRVQFSTMGAGYTCLVNGRRVFCTHGNEVDPWNFVRYEELARVARRLNSGRSLKQSEWEPNAGTKLVKEVMNGVKKNYRWIDLLKPEDKAAIGVLAAIDLGQTKKIRQVLPIIGGKVVDGREVNQRLAADGFSLPPPAPERPVTIDSLLGPNLAAGIRQAGGHELTVDDMLRRAEENFENSSSGGGYENEPLGTWGYIWDRITSGLTGVGKVEALRRALRDWLERDPSFDISDRDKSCKDVIDSIGTGIDFVVTGHTHLERAIALPGGLIYFNSGTWIRLLKFSDKMLENEESFKPVYEVLKRGTMQAIDQAEFQGESFVLDQCGAVRIKSDGQATVGELLHILGDGRKLESIKQFIKE